MAWRRSTRTRPWKRSGSLREMPNRRPRRRVEKAQHAAWQRDVHALDRVVEQVRVQRDDAEGPCRVAGQPSTGRATIERFLFRDERYGLRNNHRSRVAACRFRMRTTADDPAMTGATSTSRPWLRSWGCILIVL
jgi:hypothetical protein